MISTLIGLEPHDVGLDAGSDAYFTEGFCDYVSSYFAILLSFLEGVDDVELILIKGEGDNIICVLNVADIVFTCSPVCEVEFLT